MGDKFCNAVFCAEVADETHMRALLERGNLFLFFRRLFHKFRGLHVLVYFQRSNNQYDMLKFHRFVWHCLKC